MKLVNFKVDADDHEAWKILAHDQKISLSEWIRRKCNGDEVLEADSSGRVELADLVPVAPRLAELLPVESGECLNRLSKGTFCKRCGRLH